MGSVQDLSISSEQDFVLSDIEIESKINPKDNGQKNILNESENGSKVEINITTPEGTVNRKENKAMINLEIRINLNSFLSLYDYKKVESSQAMLQQCINPHLRINSTCY